MKSAGKRPVGAYMENRQLRRKRENLFSVKKSGETVTAEKSVSIKQIIVAAFGKRTYSLQDDLIVASANG